MRHDNLIVTNTSEARGERKKNIVRKSIGKDYASMKSEINGNDKQDKGAENVDSKISTSVALRCAEASC